MKRIAIVGREPSSQGLAPWGDASWELWACSLQHLIDGKKVDQFFELHHFDRLKATKPKDVYQAHVFLLSQHPNVWLGGADSRVPNGKVLDWRPLVAEFGPYFFTSSIAWMFAKAIVEGVEEIGLWGADMTAEDEYIAQRPGVQYFIWEAKKRGIKVTIPLESDVEEPPALYGFREFNPFYRKQLVRKRIAQENMKEIERRKAELLHYESMMKGALECLDYDLSTWGGVESLRRDKGQ